MPEKPCFQNKKPEILLPEFFTGIDIYLIDQNLLPLLLNKLRKILFLRF